MHRHVEVVKVWFGVVCVVISIFSHCSHCKYWVYFAVCPCCLSLCVIPIHISLSRALLSLLPPSQTVTKTVVSLITCPSYSSLAYQTKVKCGKRFSVHVGKTYVTYAKNCIMCIRYCSADNGIWDVYCRHVVAEFSSGWASPLAPCLISSFPLLFVFLSLHPSFRRYLSLVHLDPNCQEGDSKAAIKKNPTNPPKTPTPVLGHSCLLENW